jgi:glycosyltransferase involved in cell wall biosynthesis
VHQGETGFQFKFGDISELAQAMCAFLALSAEQRRAMGSRAQRLVLDKYSIEAAVEGTIKAVQQVSHVA